MKLTLDALRVMDAIDQAGSFAGAGELLFRVPSAITYSVRKLEDDLGVAIFDRSGRKAQLTEAGRVLLERGRRLLIEAEDLEDRVRRMATGWESEIRIAVDDIIGVSRLMPLLTQFYADARESTPRVRLLTEVYGGPTDALAAGRADLAIGVTGELPQEPAMRSQTLGWVRFLFCVSADHPLVGYPDPITADVLRQYRAVVVSDTSRTLPGRSSGFLPEQDVLSVPSVAAKLAAQLDGLGVGFLPSCIAGPEVTAGRLVVRDVGIQREPALFKLVWRADREGRAMDWFVRTLSTYEPILALLDPLPAAGDPDAEPRE